VAVERPGPTDRHPLWFARRLLRRRVLPRLPVFVITPHSHQHDLNTTPRKPGSFNELRRERRAELDTWMAQAPRLQTDSDALHHAYQRSLTDLAALRFYPHIAIQDASLPAAGLPWFMTLFGRDSLITSYQTAGTRAARHSAQTGSVGHVAGVHGRG
jgi:glycogen debranching enzyme